MKHHFLLWISAVAAASGLIVSCASYDGASPALAANSQDAAEAPNMLSLRNAPVPEERPGLATGWGKEKESSIYSRDFVRASSKPYGTDMIYYNNPEGIKAMTRHPSKVKPMQRAAGELVEWGVKSRGRYLPTYKESWGYGRRLVEGKRNAPYEIVVKNRSKSTLEIVCSVDGLDVMDGRTASFKKRGYLVDPGKTLTIDGFRTSHHSVASFKFSGVADSYANLKHGDTRNVGVIGLAVFTRKGSNPWTWMPGEVRTRNNARAFAEAP
ncbi:MAG: hypothetical protein ACQCXQ_06705 [Verrucomicrobiales bacterium]|nr:hypothetical protein [Verrucomicrobiota bacterium JB025]